MIYVILRHWSRDEDERQKLIPDAYKLVPTREDLRYEAAFALVLLFTIAPMGFSRLDAVYPFFPHPRGSALLDTVFVAGRYVAYSWYEFPHSVPIVHALSAFHEGNPFAGGDLTPLIRGATFALRLAYEIFAVSAIINLVRVGRRIADLEDMRPIDAWLEDSNEADHLRAVEALETLGVEKARFDALDRLSGVITGRSPSGEAVNYSPAVRLKAQSALAFATQELGLFIGFMQYRHEEYRKHAGFGNEGLVRTEG